jgi:HlyD family secretion protein
MSRSIPRPALRAVLVATAGVLALAGVAGCNKDVGPKQKTAEKPLAVSVATVEMRALKGGLTASGVLIPREEAAVTTELNGYRVAKVFVDQDAWVKQGQPLVQLDDTLLRSQIAQMSAMVAQQQVAAERAADEAKRVAGLDNMGVLPQEQIAERRLAAKSADAAVAAAKAQLDDLKVREGLMTVRAPVSGRVLERTVRPGDVASPSAVMFRIARDGVIELNAEVAEPELPRIHPGDRADVSLPSGETVAGVVRLVSPQVDANSRLGRVRVTLPVRADLRSGGFGKADFSQSSRQALVAPETAIRFDSDGASVLVLGPDNRAHHVSVRTGARAEGRVELVQGPPSGSKVLLSGGAFVVDGDKVQPVEGSAGK